MSRMIMNRVAVCTLLTLTSPTWAQSQETDFTTGEILTVSFPFCPRGTLPADGRILQINDETSALFSLYSTQYGGSQADNTFALPDLRGRTPVHSGLGRDLRPVEWAEDFGQEGVMIEVPAHTHMAMAGQGRATERVPLNNAIGSVLDVDAFVEQPVNATLAPGTVGDAGESEPFPTVAPSLALRFCVVVSGYYPRRY